MPRAYVSVGSNVERETHIRGAIRALAHRYGQLRLSSVYDSCAVGFDGANFYNMVVSFETAEPPVAVEAFLKALEAEHGRDRTAPRFSDRTLDLDLLLYGNLVVHEGRLALPRSEVLEQAFVLAPLAEIAGDEVHPIAGKPYRELWRSFDASGQEVRPVDLDLEDAGQGVDSRLELP